MKSELGVIGSPISQSVSPAFQQAALDHAGIKATYLAYDVAGEDVGEFVRGLRQPGVMGINITTPHKGAVIPYLDELDDWATAASAVNTIVNRQGRLTGYNTDSSGFLRALRDESGFSPGGRRALVLGAGGAARAVVLALSRDKIASLTIANRTLSKAQSLAELAQQNSVSASAIPLERDSLTPVAQDADLIVNCTSMGMTRGSDASGTPLTSDQIPATALVNDLVYNPRETALLREAVAAGAQTLGGIYMLVYQGVTAFEIWTGKPAPVAVMLEAALSAMAARS
ncbi:MAG: shikimate dehydrogenase [SAR202 cluster bacterium Io17-Chloro-G9]|nr:MAG: shikimate dehydrogenase [SAR202 cluster bacterium Io17-Chloro-G9]